MQTTRPHLLEAVNALLQPERFQDYAPNGLQVEGRLNIHKLVSAVTASRALIEAAIAVDTDAILVHHGLFWRGHDVCVTGWMKLRLQLLLQHDINLLAYHLPMDAHPALGNNVQLGSKLGLAVQSQFGEQQLGFLGVPADGVAFASAEALAVHVGKTLGREVTLVAPDDRPITSIAWCCGGAQGMFEEAIAQGVNAYITGEISEPQAHYAREMGVAYIAAGHHATERYGAPAVAGHIAAQLGLEHLFIDIENPA